MKLCFLGTGTSFGVPVIGCGCDVCTSSDPRDRRTRHGALIQLGNGRNLLVDTPPELRLQLVAAGVSTIDGVFFTHAHADHTHGIDDLRVFTARRREPMPAWSDASNAQRLRSTFPYIFDAGYRPPVGTTRPEIDLRVFEPGSAFELAGAHLTAFALPHGDITAFGFRLGPLGYVTDAKRIPAEARAILEGVRVLVINALWHGNPHPTHFNVEEAVAAVEEIGPERAYLTHLTHRVRHAELARALPDGIEPAHDSLVVTIDET